MPRNGSGASQRGGQRAGAARTAYGNRSDLNGPIKPTAVPDQPYGEAGKQLDAQAVVPMGTPEVASGPPAMPEGLAKPGSMGDLFAPSTNPDEDVMSGSSMGPGPGPAAFGFGDQVAKDNDMAWARRYLPALEMAANGPKGTTPARQIIRLLKAQLDPQ